MKWAGDIALIVVLSVFLALAEAESPWSGAIIGLFVYLLILRRD